MSCFRLWKTDQNNTIRKIIEDELQYWKVPKFVKDTNDQKAVIQEILNNCVFLKTLFTILCCKSNYPTITWIDFVNFTSHVTLILIFLISLI